MRTSIFFFFLALTYNLAFGQNCKKLFKDYLEKDSKIIACANNYTIEKLPDGTAVYKQYYTGTNQLTNVISCLDKQMNVKHGLFEERYDDGTVINSGHYDNDIKTGFWIEDETSSGEYVDGKKQGKWTTFGEDSTLLSEINYDDGNFHGFQRYFKEDGTLKFEAQYSNGELVSQESFVEGIVKTPAQFPGCDSTHFTPQQKQSCADKKFLEYIYGNVRYPEDARERSIGGDALVRFTIDDAGHVKDIKVLNGLSPDIKKEVIRLIKEMPKWQPALDNDIPVKSVIILPIKFRVASL